MKRDNGSSYKRSASTLPDGSFYEIEYDTTPFPGVGKFVRTSQKLTPPEHNQELQLRRKFQSMREIARQNRTRYPDSQFFDPVVRNHNSRIFYKQAVYMEDVTDDYDGISNFTSYYPSYQQMGFEQLRTYFSWRAQVRKGIVSEIPLSYAYVYLYELLMNIGVGSYEEGLERLLAFWMEFRDYDDSLDHYVPQWLKDYHIYYPLPWSFEEFVREKKLTEFFPDLAAPQDDYALFRPLSRYEIEKSSFYTEDRKELIHDCFLFVIHRLRQLLSQYDLDFDVAVFRPTQNMTAWTPFQKALFYPWIKQPDRRVVFSPQELYVCCNNKWTASALLLSERNRRFVSYILKQMEVALRQITQYRYKLSASLGAVSDEILHFIQAHDISFEAVIKEAVKDFYKEWNKVIVQVDETALRRIRQEALVTQERLTVPEEEDDRKNIPSNQEPVAAESKPPEDDKNTLLSAPQPSSSPWSPWAELFDRLSELERSVLSDLLQGTLSLPEAARRQGLLPEVLADSINEKAADCIGDSLMDEDFQLYDDYIEPLQQLQT